MEQGYVIKNKDGNCLSRDLFWFNHENDTDAYVHPKTIIQTLFKMDACNLWTIPPHAAYPAQYDGETKIMQTVPILFDFWQE